MRQLVEFILLCALIYSASSNDPEYKSYEGYKVFSLPYNENGHNVIEYMKKLDDSLIYNHNIIEGEYTIMVSPQFINEFNYHADLNLLFPKVIIEDFSEIIRLEKEAEHYSVGFNWTAYHDVDVIYEYLRNVSVAYPGQVTVVVAGKSYENRDILGIRINTPSQGGKKPVIFIESGIHAREWITPATTTYFINQLLTSKDPNLVAFRDLFDWHIFPSVNPDGYQFSRTNERLWRKTRSKSPSGCYGADPNRNWDYNWLENGATNDSCDHDAYAGSRPFSEVETLSLSKYIAALDNLQAYLAFHCDGQMLLVPFSDSVKHFDNYDDLITIGKEALKYGFKVNNATYGGPATATEILYKASGVSMDWVRQTLHTPLVYTFELRGRGFVWPAEKIHEQGDEVTQMLIGLILKARSLGYLK